ncbi:GntR family transcriptional regulator [Rhodobacteraceae bacterium R_SAG10]|jgi:GntR family transcriptional regulator|nr:GntR family transcriptional regulator [Rhodobacteraceae bacterium R_SAG10]
MKFENFFAPAGWLSATGGPRYIQLKRRIEDAIATGHLPNGTPLPPERKIATITGLSRVTVRKAMRPLVEDGLIVQLRGSGSTIARPVKKVEQSLSRLTSFTEDMARRGIKVTSTWLESGIFMPSPEEIMALGLSATESVSRLSRLRLADGTPLAIERAALSPKILPDPTVVETSLYEALGRLENKPVRAVQRISATNLGAEDAGLLEVEEGLAALKITRISYLATGQVVELTKSIYRGDAYDFVAELRLPLSGS